MYCGKCRGEHHRGLGVAPAKVPDSSGEGKTQLGAGETPRKGGVARRGKRPKRAQVGTSAAAAAAIASRGGAGAPSFGAAAAAERAAGAPSFGAAAALAAAGATESGGGAGAALARPGLGVAATSPKKVTFGRELENVAVVVDRGRFSLVR